MRRPTTPPPRPVRAGLPRMIARPDARGLLTPMLSAERIGGEQDFDDLFIVRQRRVVDPERPGELRYFVYEVAQRDPGADQVWRGYKVVRFVRLTRVPRYLRSAASMHGPNLVFEQQRDLLASLRERGVLFVNLIAHSPELPMIFAYGVQGVADTLEEATQIADESYAVLTRQLDGVYQQLEYAPITLPEGELITRYQAQWTHVAAGRGRPMPAGSTMGSSSLLDGNRTDSDSTSNQLESFLRGMADRNFLLTLITVPMSVQDINHAWASLVDKLSDVRSDQQGQRSWSTSIGVPLSLGAAHADSHGVGHSVGSSDSVTDTSGTSTSHSVGDSATHTAGVNHSVGDTTSSTHTSGTGDGTSATHTDGSSAGTNTGTSTSSSHGDSQTATDSTSSSTGTSTSTAAGTNSSHSTNSGVTQTEGTNSSTSVTNTHGVGHGTSTATSDGHSSSHGGGSSRGVSDGTSSSSSYGVNVGSSDGRNLGTSVGRSDGASTGGSLAGINAGTSVSVSAGNSLGSSNATSDGMSFGSSSGASHATSSGVNSNWGVADSHSTSHGTSTDVSDSRSVGVSTGTSSSRASTSGVSDTTGTSLTNTTGTSATATQGSSTARGVSSTDGTGTSAGSSQGSSAADAAGTTSSRSDSTATGSSRSTTSGTSSSDATGRTTTDGTGTSASRAAGSGTSDGLSTNTGSSLTESLGAGFVPSVGYSVSKATFDEGRRKVADLIEAQVDRYNEGLKSGAYLYQMFLVTPTREELVGGAGLLKSAFWGTGDGSGNLPQPFHVVTDFDRDGEDARLLLHARAFTSYRRRNPVSELVEPYLFSSYGTPQEIAAFTHPPTTEAFGLLAVHDSMPVLRMPHDRQDREIYLGHVVNGERGRVSDVRFGLDSQEMTHCLFAGLTGSGKTTSLLRFLAGYAQVRRQVTTPNAFGMPETRSVPGGILALDFMDNLRDVAALVEPERFRFYSVAKPELGEFRFNMLALPDDRMNPYQWINELSNQYCAAWGLGEFGRSLLVEYMQDLYGANRLKEYVLRPAVVDPSGAVLRPADVLPALSVGDVPPEAIQTGADGEPYASVFSYPALSRLVSMAHLATIVAGKVEEAADPVKSRMLGTSFRDRIQSLWRRVSYFAPGQLLAEQFGADDSLTVRTTLTVDDLVDPDRGLVTVIETEGLDPSSRRVILGTVLLSVFHRGLIRGQGSFNHNGQGPGTLVVMEEAHELVGSQGDDEDQSAAAIRTTLYESLLRRSRQLGLRIALVVQNPAKLPSAITGNVNTVFLHQLTNDDDRKVAFSLLNWSNLIGQQMREWRYLGEMARGFCIVRMQATTSFLEAAPVQILVDPLGVDKVSDAQLRLLAERLEAMSWAAD